MATLYGRIESFVIYETNLFFTLVKDNEEEIKSDDLDLISKIADILCIKSENIEVENQCVYLNKEKVESAFEGEYWES